MLSDNATSAGEWVSAVALDANALAWSWSMDVFAIANVDANVVRAATPEYEITWLQIAEGNRCRYSLLAVSDTWDGVTVFCVNVLHKTAAVKTAWAGAAPYVWYTQVFHSGFYNFFASSFFHISGINAVSFERFPKSAVVYFNEHEGVILHGNDTVGQLLNERHWHVGGIVDHLNRIIGTVGSGGNSRFLAVVVELHVAAGSGEFQLTPLLIRICGNNSTKIVEGAAQWQIEGAFVIDDGG